MTHRLAAETNALAPEAGMLVMVPAEAGKENMGGAFFILLEDDGELKDHTIFGRIRPGGLGHLKTLGKETAVSTLRIERKGEHAYKPVRIEQ